MYISFGPVILLVEMYAVDTFLWDFKTTHMRLAMLDPFRADSCWVAGFRINFTWCDVDEQAALKGE